MSTGFIRKLERRIAAVNSLLCVGIDPPAPSFSFRSASPSLIENALLEMESFCLNIVETLAPFACAFKPNSAFFEQFGPAGLEVLRRVIRAIPPDIPVILDVKRSATGDAADAYARAFYGVYGADCVTVDPYLGPAAVEPFIGRDGNKGVFVVCRSSNPHSSDMQCFALNGQEDSPLFFHVAGFCEEVRRKNEERLQTGGGGLGLVVGATYATDMRKLRSSFPHLWILAPGIGAQGGDLRATVAAGLRDDGLGLVVPIGRAVFNSPNPPEAARKFRDEINEVRASKSRDLSAGTGNSA